MSKAADPATRPGGRPSRERASQIRDTILDNAEAMFLTQGYGETSIEQVARACGMSKRTFYSRFADKAELFFNVVHRIVERMRSRAQMESAFAGAPGNILLRKLAHAMLEASLTPEGLALQRILFAETQRFPELYDIVQKEGARREGITFIATLLAREVQEGRMAIDNPAFAAEQFMQLITGLPQRRALMGHPMSETELSEWADNGVDLFLRGYAKR